MEKWLVVSNCNTTGLANCLGLMCPDVEFEPVHLLSFAREVDAGRIVPGDYSRAIVHPKIDKHGGPHVAALPRPVFVPSLFFCGYHPDVCYVHHGSGLARSPVGEHHSAICFTAHQAGLSPIEAERLFNARTYESAGYFDVWHADRETEIEKFAAFGIDLAPLFVRWARKGPFMHTINHPVIGCIHEIAALALDNSGIKHLVSPYLPQDNLIDATAFPIYPEIGEACGVPGTLHFKLGGLPRLIGLREFIRACYAIYDRAGRENLTNSFARWDRFQKLKEIVG